MKLVADNEPTVGEAHSTNIIDNDNAAFVAIFCHTNSIKKYFLLL